MNRENRGGEDSTFLLRGRGSIEDHVHKKRNKIDKFHEEGERKKKNLNGPSQKFQFALQSAEFGDEAGRRGVDRAEQIRQVNSNSLDALADEGSAIGSGDQGRHASG
jgi:hypothetical protein